tara:strand:+ start:4128 stop:4658 length:531 start_codon:yes stop_codon:yes gene_type:complete
MLETTKESVTEPEPKGAPLDVRFVNLRDGHVDNEGHPFDVDTDDEADEEVCATLRRIDPSWVRRQMTHQEMIEYQMSDNSTKCNTRLGKCSQGCTRSAEVRTKYGTPICMPCMQTYEETQRKEAAEEFLNPEMGCSAKQASVMAALVRRTPIGKCPCCKASGPIGARCKDCLQYYM